jgi:hypothetical protein
MAITPLELRKLSGYAETAPQYGKTESKAPEREKRHWRKKGEMRK